MSPPKNNLQNTNHHSSTSNKPSPSYGNTSSNALPKNIWQSPNQRARLDLTASNASNQSKKESAYSVYTKTPQNIGTGTGVPSSTMEQSPAPHHLPIPFGLSTPTFEDSAIICNSLESVRDVCLLSIFIWKAFSNTFFFFFNFNKPNRLVSYL